MEENNLGTNHKVHSMNNLHHSKDSQLVFLLSLGNNKERNTNFLTAYEAVPSTSGNAFYHVC